MLRGLRFGLLATGGSALSLVLWFNALNLYVGTRDDKDILQWLQDNVVDGVYINFPR